MMDEAGRLGEAEPCLETEIVEETEFNPLGVLGKHGEVRAGTIPRGALGVRPSGPDQRCQEFPSGR